MPPTPKLPGQRTRTNKPISDWKHSPDGGWQHPIPEAPDGLLTASVTAWALWFDAWWAVNWTPQDVPQLELAIKLYDSVQRGDTKDMTKFQTLADSLGITPKGRASLRWLPPKGEADAGPVAVPDDIAAKREARAARLA